METERRNAVAQHTVNRPSEIVPTNFVMLIGHGIFAILLMCIDFDDNR